MKKFFMTALAGSLTLMAFAQEANNSLVSFTGIDKVAIARNSISLPTWHEKTFWPIYENYVQAAGEFSSQNITLRKNLADAANSSSSEEAATAAENVLKLDFESLANKRKYYQQVSDELNGIISLQFLQGEIVMEMMESSNAYENTNLRKYKFHPAITSEEQFRKAKHNAIQKALGLTKDSDYFFWNIYNKYEEEMNNVLGEEYSLLSFYAGEPTDFTPALAKRMGHDALAIMEREIKLKEKYYLQLKDQMGGVLAAKFLAWEDYYSLVSKMHAWADAP
jgi:hypothetical protein